MTAGQTVWIHVGFRTGGYNQQRGPWMAFCMTVLTADIRADLSFTWRLHETTFWSALRRHLFKIALIADLGEIAP